MTIYTKRGLKIRLDQRALEPVIAPLRESGQLEDILTDMELWMDLPNSISSVAAIITAILTTSWVNTLLVGVISYFVGAIIQELIYSELLKRIFPQFFGGWIISVLATIICIIYLSSHGYYVTILILVSLVLGNLLHYTDFLLWFVTPFSILISKSFQKRLGVRRSLTVTERLFVFLCNRRAEKIGVRLDWELYDKPMKAS